MRAEIISVGTELLLGHVVNTDAAFLGRELALLGFDLHHTSVVGDNAERLAEVLTKAIGRSDLVITTGGLGPTLDDLTKKTVASVLARPLVHDDATTAALKEFFGTRPYDGNQEAQAYFPEGATIFVNNHGTAPGCAVTADNGCLVMLFPGPPRELEPMFRDMALPILEKKVGASIVSFMVRTFDIGEGNAATRLGSLCEQQNPTVATYLGAHNEVFARVTAKAATAEEARALALPTVEEAKKRLGDVVYGVNVASLEEVVVGLLRERGEEVATAESCTGGMLAMRITDIPGSSAVFRTGLVTYANETKTRLLNVPEDMLRAHGAVSEEVARAMAEGVKRDAGSTYGIGITGIAGPDGGSAEKPLGLVYIALATPNETYCLRMQPKGIYRGRSFVRERSVGKALDMLRRYLEGYPVLHELI